MSASASVPGMAGTGSHSRANPRDSARAGLESAVQRGHRVRRRRGTAARRPCAQARSAPRVRARADSGLNGRDDPGPRGASAASHPEQGLCGLASVVMAEHRVGAGDRCHATWPSGRTHADDLLSVYRRTPQVLAAVARGVRRNHGSIVNQGCASTLFLRETAPSRLSEGGTRMNWFWMNVPAVHSPAWTRPAAPAEPQTIPAPQHSEELAGV